MHARRITLAAAVAVPLLAVTGCAKFDAALGKQSLVVAFNPNTSIAAELKVRAACSHIPNARPEKLPSQLRWNTMADAVAYNITNASDANTTQLDECLTRFKVVQGVNFEDVGDEGD